MPSRLRRERVHPSGNEQGARLGNRLTQQIDERIANAWVGNAVGSQEELHNLPVSCDDASPARADCNHPIGLPPLCLVETVCRCCG